METAHLEEGKEQRRSSKGYTELKEWGKNKAEVLRPLCRPQRKKKRMGLQTKLRQSVAATRGN